MKTTARLITTAVLLTGAFFTTFTMACSTDAWASAEAGAMADDPTNGVSRLSGFCALEVTGTGHVVDNSPTAETTFIGSFWMFPKNLSAGTYEIFVALSDEGDVNSDVFVVSYDGANFVLDASAAGGDTATVAANTSLWNQVEFSWSSGGVGSLWVNSDATVDPADDTFAPGTGSIEQVRMGAVDGISTDTAFFDHYESHRSLPVGPPLIGDSNDNGSINLFDLISIQNDILGNGLAAGQPDCNLNGSVNLFDLFAPRILFWVTDK